MEIARPTVSCAAIYQFAPETSYNRPFGPSMKLLSKPRGLPSRQTEGISQSRSTAGNILRCRPTTAPQGILHVKLHQQKYRGNVLWGRNSQEYSDIRKAETVEWESWPFSHGNAQSLRRVGNASSPRSCASARGA